MPELPVINPALHHDEFIAWLKQDILPRNLAMHHPHSMAHQAAPPLPMAALCDLVASMTNQAMAVYETGPAATLIEHQVIRWLNTEIGWTTGSGVLTSGGSQANLTALLAARQQMGSDIWHKGVTVTAPRLRILTSALSHYSIRRAAGIMGLGADAVIAVEVDAEGRMCDQALKQAHETCIQNHEQVMAVVATAGCTPTGSIDSLQAIGTYCQTHHLWLHIDAAHGASALLSDEHRMKLQGIEMADSITWDAHKLLYMPATVSAVLFRDEAASYSAFAQKASYLFHDNDDADTQGFNTSYRTLECTKRMMGLKLMAAFKLYGRQGMATLVEHAFSLADQFARQINRTSKFKVLMTPQTNIVCFRYEGHHASQVTLSQLNQLQTDIRQKLLHQGMFHLSQVTIDDCVWLRCTFMNPYTQASHQETLLKTIACIGEELLALA